ncbi:MAG: hypothetical protein ACI4RH_13845 [Huintestinicola sp.]
MFRYSDKFGTNIAEINGVIICCDEVTEELEALAQKVADIYPQKIDEIIEFLIDEGITDYFGELSEDDIKNALGKPLINIGNQSVSYLEHTLDDVHTIDFEYGDSEFDDFMDMTIDG